MTTQTDLDLGLQPVQYVPFRDVYHLKGEEKRAELEKMVKFIESFHENKNPNGFDKRHYFDACLYLERDLLRQTTRLHLSFVMYGKLRTTLVEGELESYKTKVKLQFMEKYQKEMASGQFTAQMSKDLDKLTRIEKVSCYKVNGLDISMRDCDACEKKICMRKPKWELEEEATAELEATE